MGSLILLSIWVTQPAVMDEVVLEKPSPYKKRAGFYRQIFFFLADFVSS